MAPQRGRRGIPGEQMGCGGRSGRLRSGMRTRAEADVVVCGGGTAGAIAAIDAYLDNDFDAWLKHSSE